MPKKSKIRPLTQEWKNALRGNFLDMADLDEDDEEEIEDALNEANTESGMLSTYRVGPYLIIPTMSDYSESSVRVLAAVGFILDQTLEVLVGNCSCATLVFVEDPAYEGPRGVLLASQVYTQNRHVLLS